MGDTIKERTLEFIKYKNISVKELSDSNKTAPKPMKNAPIFTGAKSK